MKSLLTPVSYTHLIPAVVTVNKPEYDPRYPTMKSKMAARKIPIDVITGADLGLEADKTAPAVKVTALSEPCLLYTS